MTIKIDLNNLANVDMSKLGTPGSCRYQDPCIIGLLMTPQEREIADNQDVPAIWRLIDVGLVEIPKEQAHDANEMQVAFDHSRMDEVRHIASKYGAKV